MKLGLEFMENERESTRATLVVTALEIETVIREDEDVGEASMPP